MKRRKKLYELVCCVLHPVAVVLIWINLLTRRDLSFSTRAVWGVTAMVPLIPFIYVLTGNELW